MERPPVYPLRTSNQHVKRSNINSPLCEVFSSDSADNSSSEEEDPRGDMDIDTKPLPLSRPRAKSLSSLDPLPEPEAIFQAEVINERKTLSFLRKVQETPEMALCSEVNDHVPLPKALPIPNRDLKSPHPYISKTSKLNPENSSMFRHQHYRDVSVSPIVGSPMAVSPELSENRLKRKVSYEDIIPFTYKRRTPRGSVSPLLPPAVITPSRIPSNSSLINLDASNRPNPRLLNLQAAQGDLRKMNLKDY